MECAICKQVKIPTKETKCPCFPCDVCKSIICIECSELSPTEIRWIPLQKKVLQFRCIKCRYETIEILLNTIKDKDNIIKLLEEKIIVLENNIRETKQKPSYAEIVHTNRTESTIVMNRSYPEVVIKPIKRQDAAVTRKDIDGCIKPAEIKIGVQKVRTLDGGGLKIRCQSKQEADVLKEKVTEKLRQNYEVSSTKMRRPKIKITNFDQNMTEEEIKKCIFEQNQVDGEVKITYIRRNKNGSMTIFGECSAAAFRALMSAGKLYIGWGRYPIYEDLSILRCFRCQEFHHKQQVCQNERVCSYCSGDHEEHECTKIKKCCKNCLTANSKYKMKYDSDHSPTDPNCNSLKYYISVLKNKIDYFDS